MKKNKVDELILAKCINNEGYEEILEIGKCYAVEEIQIGQSSSTVIINGYAFNSIKFKYYNDKLEEFDIYHSKYSPYHKIIEEDKETVFIPIEEFNIHFNLGFINYKNIEVLKEYLNKDFQTIYDTLDLLIKNQKKLIDVVNKLNKEGK